MIKLAPSILSADFARLLEDVKKVENAGCEYLHIDVMDGHFVPNITLGPNIVKSLRNDVNMVFDAHLMIENPDQYIKEFVDAGCDIIVVHQEACKHLHRTIQNIKSYGIKSCNSNRNYKAYIKRCRYGTYYDSKSWFWRSIIYRKYDT